jgi:hypothetical protein
VSGKPLAMETPSTIFKDNWWSPQQSTSSNPLATDPQASPRAASPMSGLGQGRLALQPSHQYEQGSYILRNLESLKSLEYPERLYKTSQHQATRDRNGLFLGWERNGPVIPDFRTLRYLDLQYMSHKLSHIDGLLSKGVRLSNKDMGELTKLLCDHGSVSLSLWVICQSTTD